MKIWIFLLIIIISTILQPTLLEHLKIFNVKPDLFIIIIFTLGIQYDLRWALFLGVFAAFLKDATGPNLISIDIFLFPLWIFLTQKLSKQISLDNNLIRAGLILILVVIHNIISRIIFFYLNDSFIPIGIFFRVTFLEAIYTACICPLFFKTVNPILEAYQ